MWFKGTQQAVAARTWGQVSSPPGIAQPPGSGLAQSLAAVDGCVTRGRFALPQSFTPSVPQPAVAK